MTITRTISCRIVVLFVGAFIVSLLYIGHKLSNPICNMECCKENLPMAQSPSSIIGTTISEQSLISAAATKPMMTTTPQYSAETGLGVLLDEAPEQKLISKTVLMKTMKYMIEERDQYDQELVAFVKSLILPPPKTNLYTRQGNSDLSQVGQSRFIDGVLKSKRDGFFIEAGAMDGELFSNTVFFELERNWTGLLIEPLPSLFQSAVTKRRRAYLLNACLSGKHASVAKIRVANSLSGRVAAMNDAMKERIDKEMGKKLPHVYVPCFPLNTVLRAIGVRNIDYFSLDVEGGELDVLRDVDYGQFSFQSLSVEFNGYQDILSNITSLMANFGYKSMKQDILDVYLVKENIS